MTDTAVAADPNVTQTGNTEGQSGSSSSSSQQSTQTQTGSESWARSWIKSDGSLDHAALEKAPDDLKALGKDVGRYKTLDEFLKGHRELGSLVGKKGIVDPLPSNATPEQVAERQALLRKVNGAPEKPDGYKLSRPQDVPEGMWDQAYADTIMKIAHKHGIAPSALQELAAAEVKYTQDAVKANEQNEQKFFQEQSTLIRNELDKMGMDFAKGKDLAERAGRKWGIDPANPLMKNASVFMLLTRIAKADGEDVLIKGELDGLGLSPTLTPDDAQKQMKDMLSNKDNPDNKALTDTGHPDHRRAVEKYETLAKVVSTKNRRR